MLLSLATAGSFILLACCINFDHFEHWPSPVQQAPLFKYRRGHSSVVEHLLGMQIILGLIAIISG